MRRLLLLFLVFCCFLPSDVFAATMASQLVADKMVAVYPNDGTDVRGWTTYLGSGFSGVVDQVSMKADVKITAGSKTLNFKLIQCDTAMGSDLSCGSGRVDLYFYYGTLSTASSSAVTFFGNATAPVSLFPNKYYGLLAYSTYMASGDYLKFYGTTQINGYSSSCIGAGTCSISPVVDFYFSLTGPFVSSAHSYVSTLQPAQGSTTASTNVSASFTYHAEVGDNLNSYSWSFIPAGSHIASDELRLTGTPTSATGNYTISQVLPLVSGVTYLTQANVCSSSGTCYGGPVNSFSVVTCTGVGCSGNIGTISTSTAGLSGSLSLFQGMASSSIFASIGAVDMCGTLASIATLGLCPLAVFLLMPDATAVSFISGIPTLLLNKLPFAYIGLIIDQVYNLVATESNAVPFLDISFASVNAHSFVQIPNFKFSSSTISTYYSGSVASTFRTLMIAVLYFLLGLHLYRRSQTLLS